MPHHDIAPKLRPLVRRGRRYRLAALVHADPFAAALLAASTRTDQRWTLRSAPERESKKERTGAEADAEREGAKLTLQ
eukprot:2838223-Rhodomonas_salina.3